MIYPVLLALAFVSAILVLAFLGFHAVRTASRSSRLAEGWRRRRRGILRLYGIWFSGYALFVLFGTGPADLAAYPPAAASPYRLPWRAGVSRFVGQGNRSFASHRDLHLHAWDFCMWQGTEVLAARSGKVVEVEDGLDGVGLRSSFVAIEHADESRAYYAHIRFRGAAVKVGDRVEQGQLVAYSGMVGQTIYPHLHFVVMNRAGTASLPISFADVPDGVPRAGRRYISGNAGDLQAAVR